MQVAEILSDLTSLRVCDYDAALTLVTTYKNPPDKNPPATNTNRAACTSSISPRKRSTTSASNTPRNRSKARAETFSSMPSHRPLASMQRKPSEAMIGVVDKDDVDLQRAIDLMDLHYGLKMKHVQSLDMDLQKARFEVNAALRRLKEDGKGFAGRT